jgi:hypothetical protein
LKEARKKRTIRMSDEEWGLMERQAKFFGLNRSKYIRFLLNAPMIIPEKPKFEKGEGEWK